MAAKKKQTFEQQLSSVEALISQMEAGGLSLEDAVKQYEEGVAMLAALEKELSDAMQRLTVIRKGIDGNDIEVPMEEHL